MSSITLISAFRTVACFAPTAFSFRTTTFSLGPRLMITLFSLLNLFTLPVFEAFTLFHPAVVTAHRFSRCLHAWLKIWQVNSESGPFWAAQCFQQRGVKVVFPIWWSFPKPQPDPLCRLCFPFPSSRLVISKLHWLVATPWVHGTHWASECRLEFIWVHSWTSWVIVLKFILPNLGTVWQEPRSLWIDSRRDLRSFFGWCADCSFEKCLCGAGIFKFDGC